MFKGDAIVTRTVVGSRSFALRTENVTAAGGVGANRAIWELEAGASVTLYFRNDVSGVDPGDASTVELRVYYETGTGTLVKTFLNGAQPATGTPYTFYATDTGDIGGSPRCGTLRLYVRAIRSSAVAYDINSDANGDQGAIRAKMAVSGMAVSAYPAGAKFAYGTAADETFTLTATHTQRYADTNNETVILASTNSTDSTLESAAEQEVGATTTTAAVFTVDDTYAIGDNNYGFRMTVDNNSLLLTAEKWTVPIASGTAAQDGTNAVKRSAFYAMNPDVTFASVTPGQAVYNREETATVTFGIQNARSEALTRSMVALVKDGAGATKKTITDTGATYGDAGTSDYAIAATDRATYDLTGEQWTLTGSVTGARFTNTPNVYSVSRKWQLGKANTGVDGGIKTGKTAGADDATARNRGQTLHFDGYVYNVRGVLLAGPTVNFNVRPAGSESYEETNDTVALSSGRFQDNYTVDTDEVAGSKTIVIGSQTTGAANQPRAGITGSGNFAETDTATPEWSVSSAYAVLTRTQKTATRTADPQDTQFTIGEDVIYHFANVLDASGDAVVGARLDFSQVNPSASTTQSFTNVATSTGGWNADPGQAFDSRAPAGSGWAQRSVITVDAANLGNTGTDDQAISMLSAFTANKNIVLDIGSVPGVSNTLGYTTSVSQGTHMRAGDRFIVGLALFVAGNRTVPDMSPAPAVAIGRFNLSTSKAEFLQTDGTWKDQDDAGYAISYFTLTNSIEGGLEWVTNFGTAGQGVSGANGYVMDTGTWPTGRVYLIARLYCNGQEFRDDEPQLIVAPGPEHPFVSASLPEANVLFSDTGHQHTGGADGRGIGDRS